MAAETYLDLVNGQQVQKRGTQAGGAGNENKLLALDGDGFVPETALPPGVGADIKELPASEALGGGDAVNVWNDGGTIKVRKADGTTTGKEANGFVKAAVALGDTAAVYYAGTNTGATGLTPGSDVFLSTATAGLATTTAPAGAGKTAQRLGVAVSATEYYFSAGPATSLA